MLQSISYFFRSYSFLLVFFIVVSCKNTSTGIPMPDIEVGYQQPASQPLKFSDSGKIDWPVSFQSIKPAVRKIDLNKVPSRILDTSGFLPFSKKPRESKLDLNSIAGIPLNSQAIPSRSLHLEVSILSAPRVIRMSRPYNKTGTASSVYEFGEPFLGNTVSCLLEDKKGFIWISTRTALYRYDGINLFQYNLPNQNYIANMIEDDKGEIWISGGGINSSDGVFILDIKNGLVKHLTKKGGLFSNVVLRIIKDNSNKIWITYDVENEDIKEPGVDLVDPANFTIKHIGLRGGQADINITTAALKDPKGNIWVGNLFSGIDLLDFENNKIKHLDRRNGLVDSVCSIKLDKKGNIWISGFNGVLSMVDLTKGNVFQYDEAQGLQDEMTWSLNPDESGNIWIGTSNRRGATASGVEIIDPEKGAIKTIQSGQGLASDNISSILHDRQGQTWIATRGGLNLIPTTHSYIEHIPTKDIISLAEDRNNKIWIATYYWGFELFDPLTGKSKTINKRTGQTFDTLQDVKESNGKLVIISNKGLE
ncbi:MAG TPA: two-component regulator propeller domain-containing protein, partial [Puia sp.]|nr:two-component regulator propeller domain-containing protein [Puia sp.]